MGSHIRTVEIDIMSYTLAFALILVALAGNIDGKAAPKYNYWTLASQPMSYEYGLLYTSASRYFAPSTVAANLRALTGQHNTVDVRENLTTQQQQESASEQLCPKKMELSTGAAFSYLSSF